MAKRLAGKRLPGEIAGVSPAARLNRNRFSDEALFNLNQDMQRLCFNPGTLRQLAAFAELKPEAPAKLTPEWLRAQAAVRFC